MLLNPVSTVVVVTSTSTPQMEGHLLEDSSQALHLCTIATVLKDSLARIAKKMRVAIAIHMLFANTVVAFAKKDTSEADKYVQNRACANQTIHV